MVPDPDGEAASNSHLTDLTDLNCLKTNMELWKREEDVGDIFPISYLLLSSKRNAMLEIELQPTNNQPLIRGIESFPPQPQDFPNI